METHFNRKFYYDIHQFAKWYMNTFYKIEVIGKENLTDKTVIYAGNHLNIFDSFLLMSQIDQYVRFMVDNKLYKYKLWEWFFKSLGTIGTNPDKTDLIAIKRIIELLKDGEPVCIFPEGHTHSIDIDLPYKPGLARISKMTDTPIQPFGISGDYKLFHKLILNIGEPVNYRKSKLDKDEIDLDLEERIKRLIKRK